MLRTFSLLVVVLGAACGGIDEEPGDPGEPAADVAIGEDGPLPGDAAAIEAPEVCVDEDDCGNLDVEIVAADPGAPSEELAIDAPEAPLDPGEAESIDLATTASPVAGSKMITLVYAPLRRQPSSTASRLDVEPHGGVETDARHPSRQPRGYLAPGQSVTLLDATPTSGYFHVRYDGVNGWIHHAKVAWLDPRKTRLQLAIAPATRSAFYKNQLRRSRLNKDGPLSSGNCGPTSLAMAALVFGAEPTGLSVEESIHRVRAKYDPGLHESTGTTRAEIASAAKKLGLQVQPLSTDLAPSAARRRLDGQLSRHRVVVVAGLPGNPGHGATAYERAFTRAYQAAIRAGATLNHASYDFDGAHSIAVFGKDGAGRYVVGDPISEVGTIAITAAEIEDFMTRLRGNRGTGNAVWR